MSSVLNDRADRADQEHRQAIYYAALRKDLVTFVQRTFRELNPSTPFVMEPFIEVLCSYLTACARGDITRLVINLPPRSLKSMIISVAFVAWCLGNDATRRLICASYGQDLADEFAAQTRKIMQSKFYQQAFRTRLAKGLQAVDDFQTTAGGGRLATSVNGPLTGRGGDFIIIDDPIKASDALSDARRAEPNEWLSSTVLSRLNNKSTGCIIVVMQRVHEADMTGHVLEHGGWTHLSFPAIAETDERIVYNTPLGRRIYERKEGEPLHPQREPLSVLQELKQGLGDYYFSAQYQQRPMPMGGGMIKAEWIEYYDQLPPTHKITHKIQSWDTAQKTAQINDYSACTTWVRDFDGNFYLLHAFRARLDFPSLKREALRLAAEFRPKHLVIEDKSSGSSLIQELGVRHAFIVKPYVPPAGQDKIMRMHVEAKHFEGRKVKLPRHAPWLDEYLHELLGFPAARHDDWVDSTSQALAHMGAAGAALDVWIKLAQ